MPDALLMNRTVLLAKIETTNNVDANPTPTADAVLAEDPEFSVETNVLERNFARFDLSRVAHRVGRKLASIKFSHEWRSNGLTNGATVPAKLGTLLRGCGFSQTAGASGAAGQVGAVSADDENTGPVVTWAAAGTWAGITQPVLYTLQVVTGGASGTAAVSITPDAETVAQSLDVVQASVVLTSASPAQLKSGGGGFTLAPTWTGSLVLGDKYYVRVYPPGYRYRPISTGFESLTFYLYMDGLLHKLTGAMGTFSINAEAGGYAKAEFTFTGQFVLPTDAALPTTARYERTLPPMVELSQLRIDTHAATVGMFSMDVGNTVSPRPDANSSDGYNGVRISERSVTGQIDPELVLVADFPLWTRMSAGTEMIYRNRVGNAAGNRIFTLAPKTQFGQMTYKDRENMRALDANIMFNRHFGNDEVEFVFS
jgi:hypothetical protein